MAGLPHTGGGPFSFDDGVGTNAEGDMQSTGAIGSRLVRVSGLVVLLSLLGAWVGAQAQTWPYCNAGCNAKEVQITGSTFTLLDSDTGRVVAQTNFNADRYCVVLAVGVTYTPLGALVPVTTVFETRHGTQAAGSHDLVGATIDFEPGTRILVDSIYLMWDQNDPGTCPYGNCAAFGGANSKCTTTATSPYADVTPPTVIVEKTTTPAGGSGFSFTGTGFPPACSFATFTLDDGQTRTCNSLTAGQYQVRESALPVSWQIVGISVASVGTPTVEIGNAGGYDGDDAYNVGDDRVRVTLGAHDTVRISFSNAQILATPVLTTTPSAGGAVGTVLNDTATLTGGNAPTGSVTFKLYDPDQTACTGTPRYTYTDSSAPYATTPGFTTDKAGTWRWVAEYAGDANNNAVTSGCNDEEVGIGKATPTLTTTPSAGGAVGTVLNDTATLTGGNAPTGSVTFKLYDPDQTSCTGTPRYTYTDSSAPYATTPGFTTDKAGTWRWVAEYAGDANNNAVTSGCNDEEVSIVNGSAITVTKNVTPDDASEWTITLTLPGGSQHPVRPVLGDGGSYTFSELASGTYVIEENDSGDYLSSVSCATCSGTGRSASLFVDNQTVVEVTFTNTKRTPPTGGGGGSGSSGGTVGFAPPVPSAGPDKDACVGERICLRGTATDPEQGTEGLRFQWGFAELYRLNGVPVLRIPSGSHALETAQGFDTPAPCFIADVAGDYVLIMTVTDNQGLSTMDSVTVRARTCGESYSCSYIDGWNLISLSAQPLNPDAQNLLSGTTVDSPALAYKAGQYVEAEALSPVEGFWVHFVSPDAISFIGREIRNDVTLVLEKPGWHLISSPFAIQWERVLVFVNGAERYVEEEVARDLLDNSCMCYDPDAQVYRVSDAVLPCQGYWVRTYQANVTLKLRWNASSSALLGLSGCEGERISSPPPPPTSAAGLRSGVLAYPNPVRHSTVHFEIPGDFTAEKIRVAVYSMAGEPVWEDQGPGNVLDWEPRDEAGEPLPWGPYAYCIYRWAGGAWSRVGCGVLFVLESDA